MVFFHNNFNFQSSSNEKYHQKAKVKIFDIKFDEDVTIAQFLSGS
jgi:hypothetical protein